MEILAILDAGVQSRVQSTVVKALVMDPFSYCASAICNTVTVTQMVRCVTLVI